METTALHQQELSCWKEILAGGLLPAGVWGFVGRRGKAFGDCATLPTGCLGEGWEAGKGQDQGNLGRKKHGRKEEQSIKDSCHMPGVAAAAVHAYSRAYSGTTLPLAGEQDKG